MSEQTMQDIEDYLYYESCFTGKMGKLESCTPVEYDENEDYTNLYAGGNYVYDEESNTYYYCNIVYDEEGE